MNFVGEFELHQIGNMDEVPSTFDVPSNKTRCHSVEINDSENNGKGNEYPRHLGLAIDC